MLLAYEVSKNAAAQARIVTKLQASY